LYKPPGHWDTTTTAQIENTASGLQRSEKLPGPHAVFFWVGVVRTICCG
jgi:hypothetical protein